MCNKLHERTSKDQSLSHYKQSHNQNRHDMQRRPPYYDSIPENRTFQDFCFNQIEVIFLIKTLGC